MDPDSDPGEITAGPDGHLWFTEPSANKIGRITPCGDGSTVSDTATWQVQADSEP